MTGIRMIGTVLVFVMIASGCSSLQSDAVRKLSNSEVVHLEKLNDGLAKASNRQKIPISGGTKVTVGFATSVNGLVKAWKLQNSTFSLWDAELVRLRTKGLAPTSIPSASSRSNDLAKLLLRSLSQQRQIDKTASDFENSGRALILAEERITSGVNQMLEQAKQVQAFLNQSSASLSFSSLDVASIGGALGEFEEGRRLLDSVADLAPKIAKASEKLDKALPILGLEGESPAEIETLMGILIQHMSKLQDQSTEDQDTDQEDTQ